MGDAVCPRCRGRATSSPPGARCERDGAFLVGTDALARSDGDPLLGALVGDRFGVLGPRAFGGVAALHDAFDLERGDRCVIKSLRLEPDAGSAGAAAIAWEARVLGQAACVAPVFRWSATASIQPAGAAAAAAFALLAMDEARGSPLAPRLRDGPLSAAAALRVARSAAGALAALHAAGVAHGDLKPAHLFLSDDDRRTMLVDFGSAAIVGETRAAIPRSATPAFAAPELEATWQPSFAGDVYALGCVLYLCLEGSPPFRAPTIEALRRAHARDPAPQAGPKAPEGMRRAIASALAKNPLDRPRDGAELSALLAT